MKTEMQNGSNGAASIHPVEVFPFRRLVARRWGIILLGAVAGVLLGFAFYARSEPVYESAAQVLVVRKGADVPVVIGGAAIGYEGSLTNYILPTHIQLL